MQLFLFPFPEKKRKTGGAMLFPWRQLQAALCRAAPSIGIRCLKTRTDCSKTSGIDMNAKEKNLEQYEKSRRKVIKSPKRSENIFKIKF